MIPGFINCHIHSHDNFNRGCLDNIPLEMWIANIRPYFSGLRHTPEVIYLRTLLGAMEMLKSGTTAVIDDVILSSPTDSESLAMVVKAYRDVGMRAVVCPHTKNIPMEKTIPGLESRFTARMRVATNVKMPDERDILRFLESQIMLYNRSGNVALGPRPGHSAARPA